MSEPGGPVPKLEVARLEAIRRLAMGAAHNLNNAFTAVVGEASFLRDDRKDDALVVEACDVILGSLERCARITRALLAWRTPSQSGTEEVELVRLLRELGGVLEETLGSRFPLRLELPDDALLVRADPRAAELLVVCLLHYAADHAGSHAELVLRAAADPEAHEVTLHLGVEAQALTDGTVEAVQDPTLSEDPVTRATLEAATAVLAELGGSLTSARLGPEAWALRLRLPSAA